METPDGAAPPGSIRSLGATLLAILRTRVALAGVELREETRRVLGLLVIVGVALLFLGATLVAVVLFVAALFWDTNPLLALGGLAVLYAAIGIGLLLRAQALLRDAPIPFEATVMEFDKDISTLRPPPSRAGVGDGE